MGTQIKRLALAAAIATAGLACAHAQRTVDPKLWIGAHGGMTMSSMEFSPSVSQKMLQGVVGGVMLRYAEEKLFGLLAEVNIEQRGWQEDFEEESDKFDYTRRLTYLTVPVMTHVYFGSSRFKGFVNLGPSVSYMIGDNISANFDYTDPQHVPGFPYRYRRTEQMAMEVSNKFDYGIAGGAGIELFVGKERNHSLSLEARYYYGLGSIFPSRKSDTFSASRGTAISVTLGYWFRVKGRR